MSIPDSRSGPEIIFRPLTYDELAVLTELLSEDFPGRDALREQAALSMARRIDMDGSLLLQPDGTATRAVVVRRIPVEAEIDDLDGVTIHVLLHVIDGRLNELEFYREDSAPIQRTMAPDALRVLIL